MIVIVSTAYRKEIPIRYYKPIIYASYKFKTKYLNDSVFDSYSYWIAHYYVDSVRYQGEWKFWQHTDVGTLPGIDEKVDLNIFNGSSSELKELLLAE
jgi:lysozyme